MLAVVSLARVGAVTARQIGNYYRIDIARASKDFEFFSQLVAIPSSAEHEETKSEIR